MERIKIDFPGNVLYSTSFEIMEEDINFAGHMGNERILHWANQIRHKFYKYKGVNEINPITKTGTIVANHAVVYKSEGFLNDEIIAEVGIGNLSTCSYDLVIRFLKKENQNLLAIMKSGIVFFDYNKREIAEIPDDVLHKITV